MNKAIINMSAAILAKGLTVALQFASRVIFVQFLSKEYLGVNGLFTNILSVLSMADLGMGTAMMYALYEPIAQGNEKKISALVAFFKKIYRYIAGFILIVGMLLTPFLKYIVNLDKPIPYLECYYWLFLMNTVFSYLFVYRTTLLLADQKEYIISKWRMIFQIIAFVGKTVVLLILKNYIIYILIGNICVLLENYVENRVAYYRYPYLQLRALDLEQEEKRKIFKNVKALFLYRVCGTVQNNTDAILISVFVGTVVVGSYSNYALVVSSIVSIITMLFGSLKASVGNMIAEKDDSENKYFIFNVLERFTYWLIGFCAVCFWVLMQDFIKIVFGRDYLLDSALLVCIIANFYTSNIRQNIWTYRETAGVFQETKYVTLVTATINLVLSVILGYYLGIHGILLATVIARMIYAWWKEPIVLYSRCFSKPVCEYFIKYVLNVLVLVITCGITSALSQFTKGLSEILSFMMKLLICIVVPNTIFAVYILPTKEGKYLVKRLRFR